VSPWTLEIESVPPLVLSGRDILDISGQVLSEGGESPSVTVTLDPGRIDRTRLDPPPLRAVATLTNCAVEWFVGLVQSVRLGSSVTLTLER
jgi:hypothetical protein